MTWLFGEDGPAIRDKAVRRLELLSLPQTCPWTIEQILDADWLPD